MDPKGKVALITGGARIGKAVAQALAARGCALSLTYRSSRTAAEESAEAAKAVGVPTLIVHADVTNEADVDAAVKETERSLGRLDILVNMASTYVKTPYSSSVDWTATLEANAKSAFLFTVHAAPIMQKSGAGRVINISDWLPVSGRPRYKGYTPYYVSKSAVIALTESLALELAPEILINAIAPGPIMPPPDLTPEQNAAVVEVVPLNRWGGAEEIAKAALFLIETDFVTGECIRVDGGRHLY
ncbi:MAG TPA: SDR family oxidoreductase [Candidatus Binataceae bacterium]|nr:SDR family oxidoreductase [Candidatus Binataceae bacterium]